MSDPSPDDQLPAGTHRAWLLALGFGVGFLIIGLLTINAYGPSWDEPLHRSWAEATWTYLRTGDTSLILELPGAGRHYGPLFYLLNYAVSGVALQLTALSFTAANHLLTLVTAAAGVTLTFLLALRLLGLRAAAAAAALLILLPPFLAHAHYNPKDVPLLTASVATLFAGSVTYQTRRFSHALAAGLLLGTSVAMKPTAAVLTLVLGGAVLADQLPPRREELRRLLVLSGVTAAGAAAGLFLTWPILWRRPLHLLESVGYFARGGFWTGNVLYFGALTPATALPWHYIPVMLFFAVPIITTLLAAGGMVDMLVDGRNRRFPAALLLLWLGVPLLLFMKPGLARYDGMRQVFFIVPALTVLAGAGYDALWRAAGGRRSGQRWLTAASIVIAGWLVVESARTFPYGGSYINAAARTILGSHLERQFEVEYWGLPYLEGLHWLQENAPPHATICVPVAAHLLAWQQDVTRPDLEFECGPRATYLMTITRFSEWPESNLQLLETTPVHAVSRLGSDLLHIYRLP